MRTMVILVLLMVGTAAAAQEGPAERLWDLYKQGRFEDVVREGKVELTTGEATAQVNLAVGRALVDLERYDEGLIYLETTVRMDPSRSWIYAWAKVYLGAAHYQAGRPDEAKQAWIQARDCAATRNATRNAVNNLKILGLAESYDGWKTFTTEHFQFRYSPNLTEFDGTAYARRHEEAYETITAWFGGGPTGAITFFVWADYQEALDAGLPPLGFARPEQNIVHAAADQTVGHEMTHVIAYHALEPANAVGLINEGTAVYHDQTGRDQLARARQALQQSPDPVVEVATAALWEDWSLLPGEISYPVGGAWVKVLLDKGGKDKFLQFFRDQGLAHAREVYGPQLQTWLAEFDAALYGPE